MRDAGRGSYPMNMRLPMALLILFVLALPATAAETTNRGVTVIDPWAVATRRGVNVAPVYMEIRASPQASRRLIGAFTDLSDSVEIYGYARVAGVLRRERLEYINIEAGRSLVPGGFHLLLVGLKEPLIPNTRFNIWLEFDDGNGFEVEVLVVPIGSRPAVRPVWIPGGPPGPIWGVKGSY
jgi:copper(I)-binding protein